MKDKPINFQSENLKVDYLTFNAQFNDNERIQKIAEYLSDAFQCNSFFKDLKNPNRDRILVNNSQNHCKAKFQVNYTEYWIGTSISFHGNHARDFYRNIQNKQLDWDIFDFEHTNLGRIDICYDRRLKPSDRSENLDTFLKRCQDNVNYKPGKRKAKTSDGVLRIGKRSSTHYFRVYLKSNGREIRFELEIKNLVARKFQYFLFSNQLQEFEQLLVKQFYKQALNSFIIDSCYTDWLLNNFRRIKKTDRFTHFLATTYLNKNIFHDLQKQEFIYRLLQLLTYIKTFEPVVKQTYIEEKHYKVLDFPVNHFLEFIGQKKNNYYQIKKLLEFLDSLQYLPPMVDYFSDGGFIKVSPFPYLKLTRKECWYVRLLIVEEIYFYKYPFYFPQTFLTYNDTYDLRVKLLFIQSFSVIEVKKELPVQNFLNQFSVRNSKKIQLRKYILTILQQAQDLKLIKNYFILLSKENKIDKVEKLTLNRINKSKSIFYFENVHRE